MNLHRNARLTPRGRRLLVERVGKSRSRSARGAGRWDQRTYGVQMVARYRSEGISGLEHRSSAPPHLPRRTSEDRMLSIAALRACG